MNALTCPVCGESGDEYRGTPKAEQRHFFARAVWSLHRVRQALERESRVGMASRISSAIYFLEAVGEELLGD